MIRPFTKNAALAATAMSVVVSTPAFAQEARADDSADDGAIIVTARRVEERLQDVPISITVFSQEEVTKRNIVNSAELAQYTPSLSSNQRYGPEKATFAIRGFVQEENTAPSVGVYFADVVGPRSGAATPSGNGAGVGSMFDLESVQVLKGPQGTLFGRNTTGGAILLVPKKPTGRLEGFIEGSLGNYDMKRVQAALNIPLADTFKVRLGFDKMNRRGFLNNHSGIGPEHFNDVDYFAARLSVVAELTPDLENYTIASYSKSSTNGFQLRIMACVAPGKAVPGTLQGLGGIYGCGQLDRQAARGDGWWDVENSHPDPFNKFRTWQVINTTTWNASDNLTIKNIVSYADFQEDSQQTIGGEYWEAAPGTLLLPLINIYTPKGAHLASQSTFTEELRANGTAANGKLAWQAGGYLEISDPVGVGGQITPFALKCTDALTYQCTAPLGFGNISTPLNSRWWRSKGLYAQGTYNLTDQLAVTAGVRYTWDTTRHLYIGRSVSFPANKAPVWTCNNPIRNGNPDGSLKVIQPGDSTTCAADYTVKSDKPTWTIDLEYKPNSDLLLFAKWSRGYRAGGVNSAYAFFETWGPEKVDTYEVGSKLSFSGGAARGYFNLTGFYNNFTNQQIMAGLSAKVGAPVLGGTAIINAGKSRIYGVEADSLVTLWNQFTLQAGYAYLNTKLQALGAVPADDIVPWVPGASPWARVVPSAIVGSGLAFTPKHRLSVTGTYTLPLDESIGKVSIGATYVYTGSQTASHTLDIYYNNNAIKFYPGFSTRNPGQLPASNLVNLNASWEGIAGSPVDLSFFMTNVTNEKVPLGVGNFFGSFGFDGQITNVPRMWGFRLKYSFGE